MSVMERDHLLFQGADWDFGTIQRIHDAVEAIGVERTASQRGILVISQHAHVMKTGGKQRVNGF